MKEKNNKQREPDVEETIEQPEAEAAAESPEDGTALADQLAELNDRYLRVCAEYDNFRKRTAKEREGLYETAKVDTVAQLLPVYDNLERALKQPTEDEAYKKGVELIMQQLLQCFEKLGVREIEAEGGPFDPEKHDAVMHIEDDALEKNVVAEVFQKGFETEERVVRHAVVKVAN